MIDSHGGLFRSVTDTVTHCFRGRQFSIRFDGKVHENTFITNPCPSTRLKAATIAAQAASLRCFLVGSLPTPWNIQVGSCLNTVRVDFPVSDSPGGPVHKNEKVSFTIVNQGFRHAAPQSNIIDCRQVSARVSWPLASESFKSTNLKKHREGGSFVETRDDGWDGFLGQVYVYYIYMYTIIYIYINIWVRKWGWGLLENKDRWMIAVNEMFVLVKV